MKTLPEKHEQSIFNHIRLLPNVGAHVYNYAIEGELTNYKIVVGLSKDISMRSTLDFGIDISRLHKITVYCILDQDKQEYSTQPLQDRINTYLEDIQEQGKLKVKYNRFIK